MSKRSGEDLVDGIEALLVDAHLTILLVKES